MYVLVLVLVVVGDVEVVVLDYFVGVGGFVDCFVVF